MLLLGLMTPPMVLGFVPMLLLSSPDGREIFRGFVSSDGPMLLLVGFALAVAAADALLAWMVVGRFRRSRLIARER